MIFTREALIGNGVSFPESKIDYKTILIEWLLERFHCKIERETDIPPRVSYGCSKLKTIGSPMVKFIVSEVKSQITL